MHKPLLWLTKIWKVLARNWLCVAAKLAREVADEWIAKTPEKPCFVAGVLGPTNWTCSLSQMLMIRASREWSMNPAAFQPTRFIKGGQTLFLSRLSSIHLTRRHALAVESVFGRNGYHLPVMISGTITDASGRTLPDKQQKHSTTLFVM